jgi:thiosulfate/3-mercaptopyruvate sulfurtransferase
MTTTMGVPMSTPTFDSVASEARVGPGWIAAHLQEPDVRVVEVDVTPAAFDAGHIPGAVFWNAYGDLRPLDYRPLPASEFARLLSRSGIDPDTTVVFYGYGAYLGYWLMRSHGHTRVCVMDGPRERWVDAGHGWTIDVVRPAPTRYPIAPDRFGFVGAESALRLIDDPDAVLVDVRSHEEFVGERFWPSGGMQEGGRAGHIPGAVWLPVDIARQSPEEIREACHRAAVGPERHVVVYCTIGNRASQVWYVLGELLGYPRVSVYYGSWAEWGTSAGMPVQTGAPRD